MRTIQFQGSTYEVPEWAKWIAMDQNGTIAVFENKPTKSPIQTFWQANSGEWKTVNTLAKMVCEEIV